jgi:hypothetical protein
MRAGLAALIVALAAAAAATAPAVAEPAATVFGLKAPDEVAGFRFNDSTNFERSKPGDGYGLDYSQPGWKLDVFIYDLKRNAIPDDAKSAIVRAEFERSREDVFLAHPRGLYSQVYLRRNFTVDDPGKRTRFQCAAFYLRRDGAKAQDGYLCVTSWNNKFIKFRMTTLSDKGNEASARKFMAEWIPVLWSGANARAEKVARPARAAAHPRRRPPPRRFVCPPNYICR